jgi:hypothetical protein
MASCRRHAFGVTIAAEGLRRIAEIYAIEKDIRGTSPGQRLSARRARSVPLVESFGTWLQAQRLRISAKSRLGEKLAYIHRHWDGLQTFLTDGRVEIDSNKVENLVTQLRHFTPDFSRFCAWRINKTRGYRGSRGRLLESSVVARRMI